VPEPTPGIFYLLGLTPDATLEELRADWKKKGGDVLKLSAPEEDHAAIVASLLEIGETADPERATKAADHFLPGTMAALEKCRSRQISAATPKAPAHPKERDLIADLRTGLAAVRGLIELAERALMPGGTLCRLLSKL